MKAIEPEMNAFDKEAGEFDKKGWAINERLKFSKNGYTKNKTSIDW
jgi:hypothetical protein